jgi:hypothetical protein
MQRGVQVAARAAFSLLVPSIAGARASLRLDAAAAAERPRIEAHSETFFMCYLLALVAEVLQHEAVRRELGGRASDNQASGGSAPR